MPKKHFLIPFLGVLAFSLSLQGAPQSTPSAPNNEPGMSVIPGGQFWMGKPIVFLFDELDWTARDRLDDLPLHKVVVDTFYMDKYEVTQADYAKFAAATGHKLPWDWKDGKIRPGRDKWPMYNVSWDDAVAYCSWAGKRLPTEAEWEKAARGGLDRKLYSWGDESGVLSSSDNDNRYGPVSGGKRARFGDSSPTNVGTFPPNGYDLYDVTGNVWEWVSDWYARDYYAVSPGANPKGPETGKYKVLRGGGFSVNDPAQVSDTSVMGAHYRNYAEPSIVTIGFGFRCAKSGEAPK